MGLKDSLQMGYQALYRGPLAIRVPAEWPAWQRDLALQEPFASALRAQGADPGRLPLGCIVAVAELAGCHTRGRGEDLWLRDRVFGNAKPGSWLWELSDVRPLPDPVACTGRIGFHDLDPAVAEAALAQLAGV